MTHLNPLHLQLGCASVGSSGVDTMLIRDDLPELGTDLVTTLTSLEVDDFSHDDICNIKQSFTLIVLRSEVSPGGG